MAVGLLLLILASLGPFCSLGGNDSGKDVCDDGEFGVEKDLGSALNWECQSERFPAKPLYYHNGHGDCKPPKENDQLQQCMSVRLHYEDHPPTCGSYRPLAPVAGEYKYLPPQRWLHTVKNGGVAFLYHPCADEEQVDLLRGVARGCLNHYVLTPYPNLTKEEPLAVVSWGCVYRLKWANLLEIKDWLLQRELKVDNIQGKEVYHKDLVIPHEPREMDRLCPDVYVTYHTHPLSSPSPSAPASQNTQPPCPSNTVPASAQQDIACARDEMKRSLHRHSKSLMVLTILLGVVLLGFVVLLLGKAVARWGQRRPKHQKYKSVSNYFPFSYKQDVTHVVIPELGMPKGGGAERQVLLDASDEDEF